MLAVDVRCSECDAEGCKYCNNDGVLSICPKCNGKGKLPLTHLRYLHVTNGKFCNPCGGTGRVPMSKREEMLDNLKPDEEDSDE